MRSSLAPVAPWTLRYLDADPTGPAGPAGTARPLWTVAQCFLAHVMPRGTGPSLDGPVRFSRTCRQGPGPTPSWRRQPRVSRHNSLATNSLVCVVTLSPPRLASSRSSKVDRRGLPACVLTAHNNVVQNPEKQF